MIESFKIYQPQFNKSEGEQKYYKLKQVEPEPSRNSKDCTEIAFWEYSMDSGFWCSHAFLTKETVTEIYEGHNG